MANNQTLILNYPLIYSSVLFSTAISKQPLASIPNNFKQNYLCPAQSCWTTKTEILCHKKGDFLTPNQCKTLIGTQTLQFWSLLLGCPCACVKLFATNQVMKAGNTGIFFLSCITSDNLHFENFTTSLALIKSLVLHTTSTFSSSH